LNLLVRPLKESEFDYIYGAPHDHYIEGMVIAKGISSEEARKRADRQMKQILPNGFNTDNHHFYSVAHDDVFAGFAWINVKEEFGIKVAWGYNIFIEESLRRKGLASFIFSELESEVKKLKVDRVRFQVYGENSGAIELYKKQGFKTTNIVMSKEIK
jgi:GNAT superfamily N-acetyltransferase